MIARAEFAASFPSFEIGASPLPAKHDFIGWLLCFFSLVMLLLVQWSGRLSFSGGTFVVGLLFILPWGIIILRQPRLAVMRLAANWPLLTLPGLALLCTIWSDYPTWSLRAATQFLATIVVGILAGTCIRPRALLSAFLSALSLTAILSIADGSVQPWGPTGQLVLVGLFGSKNYFALSVSLLLLVALPVLLDRSQSLYVRGFAVGASMLALGLLAYTRSAGIIVATAATLALMSVLFLVVRLAPLFRIVALGFVAFMGISAIATGIFFIDEIPDLLNYMGKDVTLTGRTYLWHHAFISIAENPVLGVGYQAFWQIGNWGAEELWMFSGITGKFGYHFHDVYLQVAVDLGLIGLLIFVAILLAILGRIVTALSMTTLRAEKIFAICAFAFLILRTPIEVDMFSQFDISTIMLCLIWIYLEPDPSRLTPVFLMDLHAQAEAQYPEM